MSNLMTRIRGNEVISATLIEIMLVLVFVLLIVIVFNQKTDEQDLGMLEGLCVELKQTIEKMDYKALALQIDCQLEKDDPDTALKTWLEILKEIDEGEWVNPGITGRGIFADLRFLLKENESLKIEIRKLKEEREFLKKEIDRLNKLHKDIGKDGKDSLIGRLSEQLAEAKRTIAEQEAKIAALEKLLGKGKGKGTEPGPCIGTPRADGTLEPDYFIRVDYTGDRPIISLRADGKHSEEIEALKRRNLIPERLSKNLKVEYTKDSFKQDFAPLFAYSKTLEPMCRYQAFLYLDGTESSFVTAGKETLIEEYFHKERRIMKPDG